MRLLNTHSLTVRDFGINFTDGSIPPYAIVSHCWMDQEPTYEDVETGRAVSRRGFAKVVQLASIAKENGRHIDWLWIDTCCIDRRQSGEQEAAVASMFQYYARAEVCLAYLHDAEYPFNPFNPVQDHLRQKQFAQSVWFKRGWTLLELLAPRELVFISRNWYILGTRSRPLNGRSYFVDYYICTKLVSTATTIPENVLDDFRQSKKCSVEQRLAWMERRQTTRLEDKWYSMLGIFDVRMPIMYGEGDSKARARLLNEIFMDPRRHHSRLETYSATGFEARISSAQASTADSPVQSSFPGSPVPSSPRPENMRLIRATNQGGSRFTFNLIEFDREVPSYAILSHVWGLAQDEVSFQLLQSVSHGGDDNTGVRWLKMAFCARQAARDGLEHFWIDTCCINKASSAELTEAINSMFLWYQCAVRCYVYMSDVSFNEGTQKMLEQFRVSRWFSRGWTLQELIAPKEVDFFSKEGTYIGSRSTMAHFLAEITEISVGALQGKSLEHFSIDERLAWAKDRQTTRTEDRAYSLQGLFDIHMPIIYGERNKAMIRLRDEIDKKRDQNVSSRSFVPPPWN